MPWGYFKARCDYPCHGTKPTELFQCYYELYVKRGWPLPRYAEDAMAEATAGAAGVPMADARGASHSSSSSSSRVNLSLSRRRRAVEPAFRSHWDFRGDAVTGCHYAGDGNVSWRLVADDGTVTIGRHSPPSAVGASVAPQPLSAAPEISPEGAVVSALAQVDASGDEVF